MAKSIVHKLLIKPGMSGAVVGAPEGYMARLEGLPEGVTLAGALTGSFDFVQVFVRDRAGLEALAPAAFEAVRPGGLLWVCYPKLSSALASDINRDSIWALILPLGWRPVTQIALDETWSALRFRPAEDVKPRGKG